MSKIKNTPGPWAVEDPMGAEIGLAIVQAGLKTYEWEFIAMACKSTAGDERMGRQRFISPEEQLANARLIAASPELIGELKKARDAFAELAEYILKRPNRENGLSKKECKAFFADLQRHRLSCDRLIAKAEGRS